MKILKALSLMLDYPQSDLQQYNQELSQEVMNCDGLSASCRAQLIELLHHLRDQDLMDLQEQYDSLFERGRAHSLLLFEHVHGESRERGQAMVDLMALYERAGYEIQVRELPDYLPLYLEFLSTRPVSEIKQGIEEVAHIVALIAVRLKKCASPYATALTALLEIAQLTIDFKSLEKECADEPSDRTLQAIDKVWEEEMVTFMTPLEKQSSNGLDRKPSADHQTRSIPLHQING